MKATIINLGTLLCIVASSCSTSSNISKCSMPFEDRSEILLSRENTDDGVLLQLETSAPVALRTLLMQGVLLQLHGIGTDTITIAFPSAQDVSDKILHHPGEVKATVQGEREKRPDMRPLVAAINNADVFVFKNSSQPYLLQNGHEVRIDTSNGTLSYSVVVPFDFIVDGDYAITLLSKPTEGMAEQGEFSSQGYVNRSHEDRPQPFGANRNDGNTDPKKTIKIRFDFKQ